MKTKNFFYLLLLPLFTLAMASCQDEEEANLPETPQEDEVVNTVVRPGEKVAYVGNVTGTVFYIESLGCWYINVYVAGTIDSVITYFPIALDEEFQVEGMKVDFSGTTYELEESLRAKIPQMGGAEYYVIEISKMIKYVEPLKIALRQTDDGYAPVVEPISAETFFQYFSKGGWNQSADYRVSPEGVVSGPYSVVGGCSTVLQYVSTTSLNDITSGIGPSGETRVASELCACEYDEQTNTLTYGSRQFTVLSIVDEEIRCTMPLDVGDYQLMSYSNVEPWVLKYIIFRHISEETMGMILSHGS